MFVEDILVLHYALHIFPYFLKSFPVFRRKWNQWPSFRAYFRRRDLVEIYMTVAAFSVLIVHCPIPFQKISLVELDPISSCIWSGMEVVLMICFPLLAHMSNPPAQSGSKLWPKSANESLAVKGMSPSRPDYDSSIASSVSPAAVTVTSALGRDDGGGIDGEVVASPKWGEVLAGPVLDDLIPPRLASPWTLQYWCYCLNSYKWEA